jgi:hypothetical protein
MVSRRNAARPEAKASASRPNATSTTQSSPRLVYRTSTTSGARTATATASDRTRLLWASAHHAPAKVRARPANPTSTKARLCRNPATTGATSTAAAAATKAKRASQRWTTVARPGASCSVVTISADHRPSPTAVTVVRVKGRRRPGITFNE